MPKLKYGKHGGLNGPRRFKIYQESPQETIDRTIQYVERFGTSTYPGRLLDKLLLDFCPDLERGVIAEVPPWR